LQNPALVNGQGGEATQGARARRQLFKYELSVGRPAEKLDDVWRGWMARYRAALAFDKIRDLTSVRALLDKVLRWVDGDERQLRNELAHVLGVVLYKLRML
jgi:hypothetical protein